MSPVQVLSIISAVCLIGGPLLVRLGTVMERRSLRNKAKHVYIHHVREG